MKDTYGMPIKDTGDDGDSMLWAGLISATGDSRPHLGIKMCQTEDGRIWRSPNRVNNQLENSFSRDMSLGFILYYLSSKDDEMANKWISYIKKTKGLFPANESSDTRHLMTPPLWWLMSYAGMKVPLAYKLTRFLLRPYYKVGILSSPHGFEKHLKGVTLLIMALATGKLDTDAGKALFKSNNQNAFFAYLSGDKAEAKRLNDKYSAGWKSIQLLSDGHQWCWERADTEEAWKDSMGWDFEFIRLLLASNLA